MNSGMFAAISGNVAAMQRLDVIANNLANVNTAGFKKDRIAFASVLASRSGDVPTGAGTVQSADIFFTDYSPGPLRQTGTTLDFAVDGDGFFYVETPQGRAYTRQGTFRRNGTGRLVTTEGNEVLGKIVDKQNQIGPITINGSRVDVNAKGEIRVDGVLVATFEILDFPKPYALKKLGGDLFVPVDPATAPKPAAKASVMQGFVEQSNVNVAQEMVQMIEANRYFETCQRVVRGFDELAGKAANDVGRL